MLTLYVDIDLSLGLPSDSLLQVILQKSVVNLFPSCAIHILHIPAT
jgi:hypothetical protein